MRHPDIDVRLTGYDSSAGSIMGRVTDALKENGVPSSEINEFRVGCMSGTYDDLLRLCMSWVNVS